MADLPRGNGEGEIAKALSKSNAQVFGIIGQQVKQVNQLGRSTTELSARLVDSSNTQADLMRDLIKEVTNLSELFMPVSKHFIEMSEGQAPIVGAAPSSIPTPSQESGDTQPAPEGAKDEGPGFLSGLSKGLGGLMAGLGGAAAGVGLTALGGGLTATSVGLRAFANPAVAVGAGVFTLFLAGLAGAAALGGLAMQQIGEGFTDIAVGMDDLAAAKAPDSDKLDGIKNSLVNLLGSFDTGDAIKMAIADGTMFSDLAKGLTDLSNTTVSTENISAAGGAIQQFFEQVGVGDVAKMQFLSGEGFSGLAAGLAQLNEIEIDPSRLENAGQGLNKFLSETAGFGAGAGAAILAAFSFENMEGLAKGIQALDAISIDPENLINAGEGLSKFLDSISIGALVEGGILETLDEDAFTSTANGLLALNKAGMDIDQANIEKLSNGLNTILTAASSDLLGGIALTAMDDNLIPFADGLKAIDAVGAGLNQDNFDKFKTATGTLLSSFAQDGLASTALGLQAFDDNLIPFAEGLDRLQVTASSIDVDSFKNLSSALSALTAGMAGADGESTGLFEGLFAGGDDLGSMNLPDEKDLMGLANSMKVFSEVGSVDGEMLRSNITSMQYGISSLSDDMISGEYDKFEKFVGIVDDLASIDPNRLNGIISLVNKMATDILGGDFKTTNQRLTEQRDRAGVDGSGGTNVVSSDNSSIVNAPQTINQSIVQQRSFASPIQSSAKVYS
jgi:hypothetical protein